MKKILLIGLIVGVVLMVVGGAGAVYAKVRGLDTTTTLITQNPNKGGAIITRQFKVRPGGMMGEYGYRTGPNSQQGGNGYGYGSGGMMGGDGYGYGPGGMMDGDGAGYGPGSMMGGRGLARGAGFMHDYMISAFASAVGLTVDEVNTRLTNGETLDQIAIAQGKTQADLPALVTQVRQDALNAAVAAGAITQAQADVMLQHMNNYTGQGFGPGFGDCPMWDSGETQQP